MGSGFFLENRLKRCFALLLICCGVFVHAQIPESAEESGAPAVTPETVYREAPQSSEAEAQLSEAAQTPEEESPNEADGSGPQTAYETFYDYGDGKRHFFWALGENFFANAFLHARSRIGKETWAEVDFGTMKSNLRRVRDGDLIWDYDIYATNQIGHPYQGALYYTGARANGFNFWESLGFAFFGSTSWEFFLENIKPSLNDLIVTPTGGAQLGEMLHRLHRETASPVGAFFISPMDSLARLSGRRPYRGERNIYTVTAFAGAGWVNARHSGADIVFDNEQKPVFDLGAKVIYGNPFVQQSKTPYDHFELQFNAAGALPHFYYVKIISDGYVFSYSLADTAKKQESTGLSLHYDVFASSFFDFGSQSLAWTLKYRRELARDLSLELKTHLGWTYFGAQNFYRYNEASGVLDSFRDYSMGPHGKLFFSLLHPRWGRLDLNLMLYQYFIFFRESNAPDAKGIDYFWFADLSYTFPLGKYFAIGISESFAQKIGVYSEAKNNGKWNNTVKLFVQWSTRGHAYPRNWM